MTGARAAQAGGEEQQTARDDLRGCRALVLMGRAPWPLDDGWKTRSGNLLKGLAARGALVDLVAFGDPDAEVPEPFREVLHRVELVHRPTAYAPVDLLRGALLGTPFSVLNYRRADFAARVRALSGTRYDLLLVEDVVMAQYATGIQARVRFLDMHNVESHLMRRYAALEGRWPHKLYARLTAAKLAAYERAVAPDFGATLVCSDDDESRLRALGVTGRVVVVPNGVDASYFSTRGAEARNGSIVFVGSMDYHANISGVLHFVRDVLPAVRVRLPRAVTFVVGKNPPRQIRDLASDAVMVTGAVPDVRPYLASASVVVVPLLVGGGTRLKILEAMAMGKAVVSTSVGAEGIPVCDGDTLALADDPASFAERVVELVTKPELAEAMGRRAREYVRAQYDWTAIVGRVAHEYRHAVAR